MNCSACFAQLHDFVDGTLPPADAPALDAHLAACPACRAQLASLRTLRSATQNLPRDLAPPRDLWPEIEARLEVEPVVPNGLGNVPPGLAFFRRPLVFKLAASLALLLAVAAAWKWSAPAAARASTPAWPVATLAGAPRVDAAVIGDSSHLRVGQWLETDATARARLAVGAIGEVSIESNSRVRLVGASATDHRLELARGRLSALIWAPPRLFFVETPSATAVDLGCAYTLDVDDRGDGTLHVTSGYVALQHGGRESVVPAGQMCLTRRGAGPGTPFAANAPAALRRALERFDFDRADAALPEILALTRAADAVTLVHLLLRTTDAARGAVFDTLARDHAPPVGTTRIGIVAGDRTMIADWAAALGVIGFSKS